MKTIVRQGTNISLYLFTNDIAVYVSSNETVVGNPPFECIADCTTENAVLYTYVTAPEDWQSLKYLFDGSTWALNPEYVPTPPTPQA